LVGDPVDFPGFASVGGEGLFKVGGVGSNFRPDVAYKNRPAVEILLIEEFAASIVEFADGGLAEESIFAIGPIEAPLVSLGIVEANVSPSTLPVGPLVSNSSIQAFPPHTLRVTEVPSNSTQVLEPVSG
jgi:hypothetical protein